MCVVLIDFKLSGERVVIPRRESGCDARGNSRDARHDGECGRKIFAVPGFELKDEIIRGFLAFGQRRGVQDIRKIVPQVVAEGERFFIIVCLVLCEFFNQIGQTL